MQVSWGLSADCRLRRKGGLATNGPVADSVKSLLDRHGVYYRPQTVPYNTTNLDKDLRQRLIWWLRSQGFVV